MEVTTLKIYRKQMHFRIWSLCSIMLFAVMALTLSIEAKDVILSIRQSGKDFQEAYSGLHDELFNDFEVKERVINKQSTVQEIVDFIKIERPKLLLLMDNTTIALFRKYQSTLSEKDTIIPSISIMGIMIPAAIDGLKNATGISYEIPVVTSVVSLRSVLALPITKVGVLHREYLNNFIDQNSSFCKREGISLVSVSLPNKSTSFKLLIKDALSKFVSEKIEAIWIPNDNALLQPEIISSILIPMVSKMKIPVIVGVEVLVAPKLNFGTFAVLPDHVSLGKQAAGMVYDIMDNNWQCIENYVEPPLAIFKIINLPQARKLFNLSEKRLSGIDKKLE